MQTEDEQAPYATTSSPVLVLDFFAKIAEASGKTVSELLNRHPSDLPLFLAEIVLPAPAPSPVVGVAESLLSAEQLAEIQAGMNDWADDPEIPIGTIQALLSHIAALTTQLAEASRELSYEQQMRQQTEQAMITLAARLQEQEATKCQPTGVVHELKTWPEYFQAVLEGRKPFEVRQNDRGFGVGDVLHLREWDFKAAEYTGREIRRMVTYMLEDEGFTSQPDCCVMGLTSENSALSSPAPQPVGEEGGEADA